MPVNSNLVWTSSQQPHCRGTQRQFSENICSEDDLRYRFFGTFVVKFLACLPLLGFSNTYGIIAQFLTDSYPKKVSKNFREPLFWLKFSKIFDPYNFRITRLSARKSEQMKNFEGIKMCLYLPFKYQNTFNNAMFKWFWTIFSLGAPDILGTEESGQRSE